MKRRTISTKLLRLVVQIYVDKQEKPLNEHSALFIEKYKLHLVMKSRISQLRKQSCRVWKKLKNLKTSLEKV